ncbi:MAG: MBL fold metallo-hydrolase [Deltaproteobacteria bacterium]|nr:MBL fold metallo-hydrolase [Deltaproteobacteria bacterium]
MPRAPSHPSPSVAAKPDALPDAISPLYAHGLERTKELDFEHRSHERSVARVTLSLRFLRAAWRRFWTRTQAATAAPVPHPSAGTIALTFVGHATVMITTPAARVLTDPLLENSLCGLRRARAAAIADADLADVGLVLISHAHRDHLSRTTLARLRRTATVVVPPQCKALIADLGFARVVELGAGQAFTFTDVEVISVPARHDGARGVLNRRQRGACGYIVRTQSRAVYFAGDTGYFSGFAEIGRQFAPDVALLPIAGYQPAPFRQQHLSPLDAVYAFEDLGARILIPITHGSFELGYEPIAEPLTWLRSLAQEKNIAPTILEHGQTCLIR